MNKWTSKIKIQSHRIAQEYKILQWKSNKDIQDLCVENYKTLNKKIKKTKFTNLAVHGFENPTY